MRLQYTSCSSSSTSLAAGFSPCLLPGPGSALAGGGCSYCWGCCYGALLFFLWTSAAVTASSSSSSSSTAGGAGATAAVTGAPGNAVGASGAAAAAASHSATPPLPAAVVAGGALVAALAAGAGGRVLPFGAAAPGCYSSPTVGSVQELAQRSKVVIEGKVQQQQGAEERRKKGIQELESVTSHRGRGHLAREQVKGETDKELPSSVVSTTFREEQVPATSWITPFSATATTTIATVPTGAASDFVTIASPTKSAVSSGPESYLVKVHQVWAVKTGSLAKDSLITVLGYFASSCLKLKEDSRYIFFMDPTNSSSVFRTTFPPLETGRNLKKDVGRVLCRGCAASPKLKEIKTQSVQEGKKLVLKCQAVSEQPSLKFRWFKGEKEIGAKNKPDSKPEHIKIRGKKKSSELQISKASSADNGEYKCMVSNQLGNDTVTVNVTIVPSDTTAGPGHLIKCSDKEKTYCVNGGECYVLNGITSSNQFMCKCPNEFTGDRCQNYVMASFYKHLGIEFMEAEELYQKRVLTITGICIALLVVGIMCVVAYCKTKKQRKKLHDRLRQSLRSERNNMVNMANGPHHPNPPPENVQLVNQYVSKNVISSEHVIERETETSFSTSHYTSTTHHSTTVTPTPSHSWSNGHSESIISESHSVIVTSSVENSRHTSPTGPRGRLNGIGGPRDCSYLRHARDTPDSYRDSPHSERYVSAMTTPARMSPVEFQTPISPKSHFLEMSPPESSLAVSVPSVAVSPFIEEERPLLLVSPPRLRDKRYDLYYHHHHYSQQYNSYHYNPAHDSSSLPPSPLRIVEDEEYETTQEYEPSQEPAKKLVNSRRAKRTKPNGHISNRLELDTDTSSESSTSESETEDERIGEETPFLSIQNPLAASLESASIYRHADSRTNPPSRFSTQEELQARLSSVITNQDPIAV
ncbi:pro-neuregulin-1, membrane-bound isoform-like isoform X4 [Xenopus laevis]|uniref:Pro-neuregulin-1, membrane-bound isoform n=2 Tax=Xenopus laevis TaxID=8355 RepID=A0A8J1M283_XENLA|nr:pro-neuregulin-1, membrane-bound isoform-like isoform X4 [Xenopus laevis]